MLKYAPYLGLFGLFFLISSIVICAATYQGPIYEYSIFNHFISELGDSRVSKHFYLFSLGLCLSGLCNALLVYAFGKYIDTPLSQLGVKVGIVSGVACFFVGLLPVDWFLMPHIIMALIFFITSLLTVAIFGVAIFKDQSNNIPKWLVFPSFSTTVLATIFLGLPKATIWEFMEKKMKYIRADLWWNPFFEWLVFFSLAFWLILVALFLIRVQKQN